jgi:isoleucyl-tRNA synthetase
MYHIAESMVRWLAPILSFTAEEIWQSLPGKRSGSVFLETWHATPESTSESPVDWTLVLEVRQAVSKQLEELRAKGQIGAPLDAAVSVYCEGRVAEALNALGDELRFVLITSAAEVGPLDDKPQDAVFGGELSAGSLWLGVGPAGAEKCGRCWHRRSDVGANVEHPTLCGRCVSNVAGSGETRVYA